MRKNKVIKFSLIFETHLSEFHLYFRIKVDKTFLVNNIFNLYNLNQLFTKKVNVSLLTDYLHTIGETIVCSAHF